MKTVLMHAATRDRIASQLIGFDEHLQVITMDDSGVFKEAASGVSIAAPEAEIVFANTDVFHSKAAAKFIEAIFSSANLDWVQSSAAGLENPILTMVRNQARIYTSNHRHADAISEWVIWQALEFFRRGREHRLQATEGKWARLLTRELTGSRWLIFGYGSIGQVVGQKLSALGAHVTGVRRSGGHAPGAHQIVKLGEAKPHISQADVVLLALPLTGETDGMANAGFFAAMRPDALFMNVGRGGLVNEADMIQALDGGQLAHAALDVAITEPLPADAPLWRHPKISLTPHDSAYTPGSIARADETFLANLERYLEGAPLQNVAPSEDPSEK